MPFDPIDVDELCQMAAETDRAILNLITVRERLLLAVALRVQPGPEIPDWRQFAECFVREWVKNHPAAPATVNQLLEQYAAIQGIEIGNQAHGDSSVSP